MMNLRQLARLSIKLFECDAKAGQLLSRVTLSPTPAEWCEFASDPALVMLGEFDPEGKFVIVYGIKVMKP